MGTSLYDLTIPVYIRSLSNLSAILAKGEAWAAEKGLDPSDLLATRLVEDMGALPAQVQRACDSAKGTAVRIGGQTQDKENHYGAGRVDVYAAYQYGKTKGWW